MCLGRSRTPGHGTRRAYEGGLCPVLPAGLTRVCGFPASLTDGYLVPGGEFPRRKSQTLSYVLSSLNTGNTKEWMFLDNPA